MADRRQDFTLGKLGKQNVLKNYIKIAIRTILRHKGYSFINVVGLAIGMTCCLLILMWVLDELSYDRFHEHADHIYRVEQDQFRG